MRVSPWSSAGTWSGDELLDPRLLVMLWVRVVWAQCWQGWDFHGFVSLKLSDKCPSYPCLARAHRTWKLSVSSRVGIPNRTPFPDLRHVPLSSCMPSITTGFAGEGWESGSRLIWGWCLGVWWHWRWISIGQKTILLTSTMPAALLWMTLTALTKSFRLESDAPVRISTLLSDY